MWKSSVEIKSLMDTFGDTVKLEQLSGIWSFWENAIIGSDYSASPIWGESLILSEYGIKILVELEASLSDISRNDILFSLFQIFYHHDLFFDWNLCDSQKLKQLLNDELLQKKIQFPSWYGRLLYDRFNDSYEGNRTGHLLSEDVQELLKDTPCGVFQVGQLLSGPFGILESVTHRYIPPVRKFPLWHCSDSGCNAVHRVNFLPPVIPLVEVRRRISKELNLRYGPPSEWRPRLGWIHRGEYSDTGRKYIDLPLIVANCVVEEERSKLFELALTRESRGILRPLLATLTNRKRDLNGSPSVVPSKLSQEEQLQLLLVLNDEDLVALIDEATHLGHIRVSLGEKRDSKFGPPRRVLDTATEFSSWGLRTVNHSPTVNLISNVWQAYEACGLIDELEWRLRASAGDSSFSSLASFVRDHEPEASVRELIFASPQITKKICDQLKIPIKSVAIQSDFAKEYLLWKLGFDPMKFDENIPRMKSRLIEFNELLVTGPAIELESARERIRSVGVNVFVSVEEFLDNLISYNVWLLASDHFSGTNFKYLASETRRTVGKVIGATLSGESADGPSVVWNSNGENALGTLLQYLNETEKWMSGLYSLDGGKFLRVDKDLPHYEADKDLRFPFRHLVLWADADREQLIRHHKHFKTIVNLINESELANIRNGLDHFREPSRFPTVEKMIACVARLTQALDTADLHQYLPKIFWMSEIKVNRFGQSEYQFKDYAGRSIRIFGPSLISGISNIGFEEPCLIAPGNLLGIPNATLFFGFRESSVFEKYWNGYPRKRQIPRVALSEE